MRRSGAEIALSLGVVVLGVAVAAVTATLPSEGGYARIGPNVVPAAVGAGIIVLGLWLAVEAIAGGWRKLPAHPERFRPSPFLWISAGLAAHMALIGWAGFVLAGMVLFAGVARGFGSRRSVRDLCIGLALSLGIFVFFVQLLNVNLPAGWLAPLLGTAGI
jgi:putative tricarboxylic transport membrane protein